MRGWVMPMTIFVLGVGLGVSSPMLISHYVDPYLPAFLKKTIHPLEGSVTHKQRQEDRLLITLTTQDGTILATFQHQIPEIDLLIEKDDLVTLDVPQYEPFVHDPPVLRVTKRKDVPSQTVPRTIPPVQTEPLPDTGSTPSPQGPSP